MTNWEDFVQERIDDIAQLKGWISTPRYRQEFTDEIMDMLGESDEDKSGRGMTRDDKLNWLVSVFLRDIGEWPPRGITEFRAIYGSFFGCADGKGSPPSMLPGWTPSDLNSDRRSRMALPRPVDEPPVVQKHERTPEEQAEINREIAELAERMKGKCSNE